MDLYKYNDLGDASRDIRLVHLKPGTNKDKLKLYLQHVTLPQYVPSPIKNSPLPSSPWLVYTTLEGETVYFNDETHETSWTHPCPPSGSDSSPATSERNSCCCEYEALSYTWGSSDPTTLQYAWVTNELNSSSERPLPIQKNLAEALTSLRDQATVRVLWIDAICINQANSDEVAQQVKRMADVYGLARRVVVWLGQPDNSSRVAMPIFAYVGSQIEYTRSNHLLRSPTATEKDWWKLECALPYDANTYAAIHEFLRRPWFERVWIVQEIQYASPDSVLHCGSLSIPWPIFRRAVLCLQSKLRMPFPELRFRLMEVRNLADYAMHLNFSRLVRRHRERKCGKPHDKIYGLLSTLSPEFAGKIDVDYRKAVSDVYKSAFIAHYQTTQRLELFNDCVFNESRKDWPSWLPDWYAAPTATQPTRLMFSSGASPCEVTYIEPNILRAAGLRCAVINNIGSAASSDHDTDVVETIRGWATAFINPGAYVTGESKLAAFSTVMCGYRLRERYPKLITYPSLQEWSNTVQAKIISGKDEPQLISTDRQIRDAIGFAKGKKFVSSMEGYFGLAPLETEKGDIVCVLLGTNVPLVLRPTSTGKFRMIGECSIHGLHDSIGLLGPLPSGWSVQVRFDASGQAKHSYLEEATGTSHETDPRLPPLSSRFRRHDFIRMVDDPIVVECFEEQSTGKLLKYDPRMTADELRSRGAQVSLFDIE